MPSSIQLQSGVIGLPASVPSNGLFGSKSLSIVDSVVSVLGPSSTLPVMYLSISKSLSDKYFFMSRKS